MLLEWVNEWMSLLLIHLLKFCPGLKDLNPNLTSLLESYLISQLEWIVLTLLLPQDIAYTSYITVIIIIILNYVLYQTEDAGKHNLCVHFKNSEKSRQTLWMRVFRSLERKQHGLGTLELANRSFDTNEVVSNLTSLLNLDLNSVWWD